MARLGRMEKGTARGSGSPSDGGDGGGHSRAWRAWLRGERAQIERSLRGEFRARGTVPPLLWKAMRHSLFPGGKRLRPALAVLGCRACGSDDRQAYRLGAALEMIHTFTLIHDDLPCMDDDDWRRGRPTCHKLYGEAIAVLAGDLLLSRAYELLASLRTEPGRKDRLTATIARAVGGEGVLGGQVLDLQAEGRIVPERHLRRIHARKTASLIAASLVAGGQLAGARSGILAPLRSFGERYGMLFQLVDDWSNLWGEERALGRPRGGDLRKRKATHPTLFGRERTRRLLDRRIREARRAVPGAGPTAFLFAGMVEDLAGKVGRGAAERGRR